VVLPVVVVTLVSISGLLLQQHSAGTNAASKSVIIEDTSIGAGLGQFQYAGAWKRCAGCVIKTANSSYYYTSSVGASATLRFNGTQAVLYSLKGATGGISLISLDGAALKEVDHYAAKALDTAIYQASSLAPGTHTLVITNTNKRNHASKGNVISLDRASVTPVTNAILYGRAASFGNLGSLLPTGQSILTHAVTNWGFAAGDSEFFSALATNGEIVLGTNPQTDNESFPTADHMNIGVFNPVLNLFRNLTIPTSTGASAVTNPFQPVGGASVDGLVPVNTAGVARIGFISAAPYSGWDITKYGEYPSLGYLDTTSGTLAYNPELSSTASQVNTKGGVGATACPRTANIYNQNVASCRGLAEVGQLPLSQKLVATQYFPSPAANEQSGRIVVFDPSGSVDASFTVPNISVPGSGNATFSVSPREIDVDPTSSGVLEYFSVIYDTTVAGVQSNFPLQEFAYNRSSNQIVPISLPILSGQKNASGQTLRFETAKYDSLGNLWATQAVTNSLIGGSTVVYAKSGGSRKLETSCVAPGYWNGSGWGSTCAPDRTALSTNTFGQTRSLSEDPATHTMFAATLSGYLMRIQQSGSGPTLSLSTLPAVNLGLDQLIDRSSHYVGIRKGVVDSVNRALYIPVIQTYNATDCPTWPSTKPCAPKALDQWLYRLDLTALAS
jgi:hypothetical protein